MKHIGIYNEGTLTVDGEIIIGNRDSVYDPSVYGPSFADSGIGPDHVIAVDITTEGSVFSSTMSGKWLLMKVDPSVIDESLLDNLNSIPVPPDGQMALLLDTNHPGLGPSMAATIQKWCNASKRRLHVWEMESNLKQHFETYFTGMSEPYQYYFFEDTMSREHGQSSHLQVLTNLFPRS